MKALDEYFLMAVFMLLLKRYVFEIFESFIWTEKHGSERDKLSLNPGNVSSFTKYWKGTI